jgi:tetratricopeptide (TPR) repeat protein
MNDREIFTAGSEAFVPQGDAARQAVDSLRGYAYQVTAAALAWLDLDPRGRLFLEVAEDYAMVAQNAIQAVQVKDTEASGTVTLNTDSVRNAVSDFVSLRAANPEADVELRYFTTSEIGTERAIDERPGGIAGLAYWRKAALGADVGPLRSILESDKFSAAVQKFVRDRDEDGLRSDLLRKIHWDCGKPNLATLRTEFEKRLIVVGRDVFGLAAPEATRIADVLIYRVLERSITKNPADRVLTRADLYRCVDQATRIFVPRRAADMMVLVSSDLTASALAGLGAGLLPDATPFADKILDSAEQTRHLVEESAAATAERLAGLEQQLALVATRLPQIATDTSARADALDKELHDQIDGYRDLLRGDRPRTALDLLTRLKDRLGPDAPQRVRYRILSNIGAAYYNLGEHDKASDFLLEAAPLNPEDLGSLANKAAALLIKNRKSEAHAIVVEALAKYPDSQELALQRLQALAPSETIESVWQSLSEKARGAAIVFAFRVGVLREAGDKSWHELIKEGCRLYPDDVGLKIFRAEAVIDRLLKGDPGVVGRGATDAPCQGELCDAAEFLEKAWRDSKGRETRPKLVCGHNAALAWNILGETARAAAILDDLIADGFDDDQIKQLRIATWRQLGQTAEAIRLSDQLSDTPPHRLLRAGLRIDSAPAEAREILKDRGNFSQTGDIIAAAVAVTESYVKEGNFSAALVEANRLEALLPGHPQGPLAHFRVKNEQGNPDIHGDLDRAAALVTDATDFPSRFIVAQALASVQRFDDVVDLLADHTTSRFDSPALRTLVAAAASADRRVTLRKILSDTPTELAHQPFYAKARIALAINAGNITEAETEICSFLAREPSNLELHIQLLHALFGQNKMEELKTVASIPADRFKGRPFDFIKLAHFKDHFGDWQEAHALAYRTMLANPASQSVTMGYISVFLAPGHSRELNVDVTTVQNDTAVELKNEEGVTTVYIIEPDAALRPSVHYLPPDHTVAKLLAGKKVGETVEMPNKSIATIISIKPKVLHALHDAMENFPNRFPEAEGFEQIKIDTTKEGGFEPMLEKLRDRHDAGKEIGKLYESGALPLSLVGRSLGCDPIEAMVGIASTGRPIRVCGGTHVERNKALAAIDGNATKGCVVDAATLHVIRRLKIEGTVAAICGPIHIIDETALGLQRKIHELEKRLNEPDLSLAYRDGQYYKTEITPEQKKEILESLEADRIWLAENVTILPAEGSRDPSPEWRELIERFGSSFLDEIRAAEGAGLMLVSEDQALRSLGQADYVVPSTWLQPILMRALERNVMSEVEYRDAVVTMIESQFQFISISTQLLLSAVHGTIGHILPAAFEKLVAKIGGKIAELESHVSVAYRTAVAVWKDQSLTITVRQAVVGRLLERLVDERSPLEVRAIIYGWVQLENKRVRSGSMVTYIARWLRGHFINLDEMDNTT